MTDKEYPLWVKSNRTWWVVTGVYVYRNETEPKVILEYNDKNECVPAKFPTQ